MEKNMYLGTNLPVGQPSASSLFINSYANISYTTHGFRTKKANDSPGSTCYASNYWHRMPANFSSSVQLRKGKELEVKKNQS
jgi:hypothetical protein